MITVIRLLTAERRRKKRQTKALSLLASGAFRNVTTLPVGRPMAAQQRVRRGEIMNEAVVRSNRQRLCRKVVTVLLAQHQQRIKEEDDDAVKAIAKEKEKEPN